MSRRAVEYFSIHSFCRYEKKAIDQVLSQQHDQKQRFLYMKHLMKESRQRGITVETGEFGADMAVSLVNDGPVTIIIDSQNKYK